jgi:hypothetical protein
MLGHYCLGLLEVMTSFNHTVNDMTYVNGTYYSQKKKSNVHNEGGLNKTKFLTGATLAKQYYWNRHYNTYKYPIDTNTDHIDLFIRKSHYGGRVEMSQLGLVEKNLYYLDYMISPLSQILCRFEAFRIWTNPRIPTQYGI